MTVRHSQRKDNFTPQPHLRLVENYPAPDDMSRRQIQIMVLCALAVVILLVWWGSSPSESDSAPVVRDTIVSPVTAPG